MIRLAGSVLPLDVLFIDSLLFDYVLTVKYQLNLNIGANNCICTSIVLKHGTITVNLT